MPELLELTRAFQDLNMGSNLVGNTIFIISRDASEYRPPHSAGRSVLNLNIRL